MSERKKPEPTIVELLAERSGVNKDTLGWWLANDKKFANKLRIVKQTLDEDPNK